MAFHFRRRKYLLSKELQLKYTLIVTLVCAAITIGLSFYISKLAKENSNLIYELSDAKKNLLEVFQLIPDLNDSLKSKFAQETTMTEEKMRDTVMRNQGLPFFLGIFLLLIIMVIFVGGIIFKHRIVGPMYVFSQYLKTLIQGQIPDIRQLRKHDEFKNFRDDLSLYVQEYKQRKVDDNEKDLFFLHNILSLIDSNNINKDLAKDTILKFIDEKKNENKSLSEDIA